MLLGRSIFHSVVDRLRAEADASPAAVTPSRTHRVDGLNMSFAAQTAETDDSLFRRTEWAYSDILADRPAPMPETAFALEQPEAAMPAHLCVLDAQAIAAELGIDRTTTLAELNDKRRAFARLNHPDRVAAPFRLNATIRMTIANQLVDAAIRKRQP